MNAQTARPRGAEDFDFLIGSWKVGHRRLRSRLAGDDRWDAFEGTMVAHLILRGQGNFDENFIDLPGGAYRACTVRLFHAASATWSIHWIDGRDPGIDPAMTGGFVEGVGTFRGVDKVGGRSVDVRFLWSDVTSRSAVWRQAFSADGGATWETNWIMEFARA